MILRFWQVALLNLKIEKLPLALATLDFHKLFVSKFDLKSSQFEVKIFFPKGFITKKMGGIFAPPPP